MGVEDLGASAVWRHRELLRTLVARELKARYRGSALGFLWSLANPLLLTGVFWLVFSHFLDRPGGERVQPYVLYLICGLFPWIWANTALLEGTMSLAANAGLIRKAVFPIGVLPLVAVISNLAHFLLALPILLAAFAVARVIGFPVLSGWALLVPLVIVLELVLLSGLALGLAVLHVHFKDVRDLLGNVLQLLFFLAPIIYPLEILTWPWARHVVLANPFTSFTIAYQDLLFYGRSPSVFVWGAMTAFAGVAWVIGAWLYVRLADTVAEAI